LLKAAGLIRSSLAIAFGVALLDGIEPATDGGDAIDEGADLAPMQLPLVVLLLFEQASGLGGVFEQRDGVSAGLAVDDVLGDRGHRAMRNQLAERAIEMEFTIAWFGHCHAANRNDLACYPVAG
jgi:hypothetical protein